MNAPVSAPQAERRKLPRPKPEHVRALADDMAAARRGLTAPDEARRANAVMALVLVERKLRNLADGMVSR